MRKRCHRTRRPVSAPMLINRGLVNAEFETRERMFVEAFRLGYADKEHFDNLADMRDCLLLAAALKRDANTIAMCRASGVAPVALKRSIQALMRRLSAMSSGLSAR